MKNIVLFFALLSAAFCQSALCQSSLIPHPYVFGGIDLNGGGYSPFSVSGGGGLRIDVTHFLLNAEVSADNAHKEDSGTGYGRYAQGRAFYRLTNGWYFGGGAQWGELKTIDYVKRYWRPAFGGGKDFVGESFSARVQTLYVLPGTDRLNAVQGLDIGLWIPSPATKGHWFYHEDLDFYEFHQTLLPGQRSFASFLTFEVMYRF